MSKEILELIPLHQITQLLETFKKDLNRYFPLVQYMTIYKEYKDGNIDEPRQTLLRYGNVEDGVYIVETNFPNNGTPYINFFIYTASQDVSDVRKVLKETNRIPWHVRGYSIQAVFEHIAPVIHEVAISKGVEIKSVEDVMMWLPPGQSVCASANEIPQDMDLKYLNSTHVQEIYHNWPNKFPGSEFYIDRQISNNFGLGLFRKTDDKMVSSAISFHSGGIFVLSTNPDFRGKGYAEIIVRNMASKLFQQGRIPFALIRKQNIPSQKLFKKIGFKVFVEVKHIFPKDFR